MVRKSSCYLLLGILLLIPGQVFSLGLGDIVVDSVLNQPLQARINLIAAREEELEELRVELAPADVFDRVGVPRPFFLTQIKFQPVALPGGGTAIRVTSKDPVREPFLTFLVEVTWPKGRLLREYTVLLDPPEFAQQQAPQISTPAATPAPEVPAVESVPAPKVANVPKEPAEPIAAKSSATTPVEEDIEEIRARLDRALGIDHSEPVVAVEDDSAEVIKTEPTAEELEEAVVVETQEVTVETTESDLAEPEVVSAEETAEATESVDVGDAEPLLETDSQAVVTNEYTTVKGDTLFAIAKAAKGPSAVTINQMMLAIQQANPDAFIRDNINLLKSGVILRIPDEATAQTVTQQQAIAEVAEQNALWREYREQVTDKIVATYVDAPDLVQEEQEAGSDLAKEAQELLKETADKSVTSKQDLNILATESDTTPAADSSQLAGGEELQTLQQELTLSKELVQSRDKENEELKNRIEALESMLDKKEKVLTIQNQQLEDLKQQLSTQIDKATAAEKLLQDKSTSETPVETEQQTLAPEPEPIEPPVVGESSPDSEKPLQADQPVLSPKLEPLPDWNALPDIEPEVVAEAPATEPPQATKPVEPPPEQQPEPTVTTTETTPESGGMMATVMGLVEPLKNHWRAFAGGGLALVAIVLGFTAWQQKRSAKHIEVTGLGSIPEALEDDEYDDILDETIITPKGRPVADTTPVKEELFEPIADFDTETETSLPQEPATEDIAAIEDAGSDDILEEADVYISYGLHQQAQDLLTEAIATEPNRKDYKLKMAEVYYSQKDQQTFEQYAESVKNQLGESSSEWQNIAAMGKELAPSSTLFAGAVTANATAKAYAEKPDEVDIDIGLQSGFHQPLSDEDLEDTVVDNDSSNKDEGLDFDIDTPATESESLENDDPVATKIRAANETSDILNFEVDDLADELDDEVGMDTDVEAAATGIHEATGLYETADMEDLTEELDDVGMQTTMDDLKPLDVDEELDDTVSMQPDEDLGADLDATATQEDPAATVAFASDEQDQHATDQFDVSNVDTEFLDPADDTVAQTATELRELGPPSLIEEVGTKLDLAKAFVDMGDSDAARETLLEVINEGDESQVKAAKDLMDKLGSK